MQDKLIESLMTKNDDISKLNNDKDYVRRDELPTIIANIVTAAYIEATNARFSQAQIDQLDAGDIHVSGTIHANDGVIGGAKIKDGLLEIKNANIAEVLRATMIKANEIIAKNVDVTFIKSGMVEDFTCHTIATGDMLQSKYPVYKNTDHQQDQYAVILNCFWFNNIRWYHIIQFTGIQNHSLQNVTEYWYDQTGFDEFETSWHIYSWDADLISK